MQNSNGRDPHGQEESQGDNGTMKTPTPARHLPLGQMPHHR